MKILALTSRLPYPPNRGDRLRAYHILRRLGEHHELVLVSFSAGRVPNEHRAALERFCRELHVVPWHGARASWGVGTNLWRRLPMQALYYRSRTMSRLVQELLATGDFDAAYIHLFRMAPYLERARGLYRIVDLTDVISAEVQLSLPYRSRLWRAIYTLELPRITAYERHVARTFEESWLISHADRELLVAPGANVQVIPNGIELDRFRPTGVAPVPHRLIFVGHMAVPHNVDAARQLALEILPRVQAEIPDTTLQIVGAAPAPEVRALATAPGVEVTGYVDDLNAHLNRAAMFVAPLRFAAGVQNKVLEAMAAARPVVTSPIVNLGLDALPDRDLVLADGPTESAAHVVALLRDPDRAAALGAAGRAYVANRFTWDRAVERVTQIAEMLEA